MGWVMLDTSMGQAERPSGSLVWSGSSPYNNRPLD